MENIGTLGSIAGIAIAVLIFALAWRLVIRARAGNARVREARRDPHARTVPSHGDSKDARRDIPQ